MAWLVTELRPEMPLLGADLDSGRAPSLSLALAGVSGGPRSVPLRGWCHEQNPKSCNVPTSANGFSAFPEKLKIRVQNAAIFYSHLLGAAAYVCTCILCTERFGDSCQPGLWPARGEPGSRAPGSPVWIEAKKGA